MAIRSLHWLWWLGVGVAATLTSSRALPARPNVLFFAADDLRMTLGCYGDPVAKTPNIDRLAQLGRSFTRAYCQQALCNPSRSSLLTGLRPDALRVWNLTTHFREHVPDVVTLPEHFKAHGYFTQDVGKIFHNWRTKIDGDPQSWSVPAILHYATHNSDTPRVNGTVPPNTARARQAEARDVPDEAYFDGRVAQEAVKALGERKRAGQPFFLGVGFWKPHLPFNPPKRYWDMYRREDIPPLTAAAAARSEGAPPLALAGSSEGSRLKPAEIAEMRHGYYAATSYLDAQLGKVLDELERLGLAESTIIVLWSDHGFHLGERGFWGKTTNYELDARVPLLVAYPGIKDAGRPSDSLVELIDLYPTLVDLCGLPVRTGLEGLSLRPVLEDPARTVKGAAFTQHPRPASGQGPGEAMGYSVRVARHRYTEWREWSSGRVLAAELYDHETDPEEQRNLAARAEAARTREELALVLARQFPRQALPSR